LLPTGTNVIAIGGIANTNLCDAEVYHYEPTTHTGYWVPAGQLNTGRYQHTATLMASGRILIAGGTDSTGFATSSEELYDYPHGTCTLTGSVVGSDGPRYAHAATLLTDGNVLVTGGRTTGSSPVLQTAQIYNSVQGMWIPAASMTTQRYDHKMTLLPNGLVLAAGGWNSDILSSAELFDGNSWTPTGAMNTPRSHNTQTLLANGKVLVAGGYNDSSDTFLNTAELYNPTVGTWTYTAYPMITPRYYHTATLLPNGKVLVAGGAYYDSSKAIVPINNTNVEIYDPATGKWTPAKSLTKPRYGHRATLLPNGKVLVSGGYNNGPANTSELYDPASGEWTTTPMNTPRNGHTATLLLNGKVLVTGGDSTGQSCELYDPARNTWTLTGAMTTARYAYTATLLDNGKVLLAAGFGTGGILLSSTELYDIGLGYRREWQPVIYSSTAPLPIGGILNLSGSRFRGISEAAGGNSSQDSPADYPVVQIRSIESEQTRFVLSSPTASWSDSSFTSTPVWNFPVGWTMATMFVNGIPSLSTNLSIPASLVRPIRLPPPVLPPGGLPRLVFTNTPGAQLSILAATNLTAPLNWTALGSPTEMAPGQFQFTDTEAANYSQRFYRVVSQ
jgi:N-acetylneuraminic acid mutarotase